MWALPIWASSAASCGSNFGILVCYGMKIVPRFCPDKTLKVNSPRTVIDLSKCPAIDTIIFEKECAISITVIVPTGTLPPECALAIQPPQYRIFMVSRF